MLSDIEDTYSDAYQGGLVTVDTIDKRMLLYMAIHNIEIEKDTTDSRYNKKIEIKIKISKNDEAYKFLKYTTHTCDEFDICSCNWTYGYYDAKNINQYLYQAFRITDHDLPNQIQKIMYGGSIIYRVGNTYLEDQVSGSKGVAKKSTYSYDLKENEDGSITINEKLWFYISKISSSTKTISVYANTNDMRLHKEGKNILGGVIITDEVQEKYSDGKIGLDLGKYIEGVIPTEYKHTFKKDKDGYYWYSTEMINQ